MATKLTFWDDHNSEYPIESIYCDSTEKYIKAIYPIYDSCFDEDNAHETLDSMDFGIFNCGFGIGTLNVGRDEDGNPNDSFQSARKGISFQIEPRFSKKGNPIKPKAMRVVNGVPKYGYLKPLRYPDSLQWIIHKEVVDGEERTFLYAPQKLESDGCRTCYGRGTKGYDVTGWKLYDIMDNCKKDGFTRKEVNETERVIAEHDYRGPRKEFYQLKWSVEYNGKSIMELVIAKPKMTYNEIVNIIVNEGGSVGPDGIIHRG